MIFRHTFAPALLLAALAATPTLAFGGKDEAAGRPFDFDAVDANKDGKLTAEEMATFRQARLEGMDADKDGFVTAGELQAFILARMTERVAEMAKMRIEKQDADKDGRLSQAEMIAAPRAEKLFARIDGDGDGAISRAEMDAAKARMEEMRKAHGRHKGGMFGLWGDDTQSK